MIKRSHVPFTFFFVEEVVRPAPLFSPSRPLHCKQLGHTLPTPVPIMTDLAGALAALAGAAGGASAPPAAARPPGPPSTSMPPELNLFAQLAAVSHLLQQAQGGGGAVPVAQGDLSAGTAPPPMVATPSVRVGPAGAAAALQHTGLPPPSDRPTRSGESGQGGRTTSSAYASRHQLAEQRRRNRINER
jgi:hypothetical protein